MRSCCFAYKTYCFFEVLVAVWVVGSLSPYCHVFNLAKSIVFSYM